MTHFDTHFDLESRLASGGYGVVHSCVNGSGQHYAVKCILNQNQGIPCLLEACIMSTIKHPYLNSATTICCDSKKLNIIQERAISDLKTFLSSNIAQDYSTCLAWFSMLTQAVQVLHNLDIVHGDIKAHNVLIYSDNSIRLTDFTLSTKSSWLSSVPNEQFNFCTASHRPYEVWIKDRTTDMKKVDIWSLGCTFYEILTATNLFPIQKKDESINALIDWSNTGPLPETNFIPLKTINHKSFSLISSFSHTFEPLFSLTFTLLRFSPSLRPCISSSASDRRPR